MVIAPWPFRRSRSTGGVRQPTPALHLRFGLGVIAQGAKQVMLGEEAIDYSPGRSMLTTIDLPVVSHVTQASVRKPFLGLLLTLDARQIVRMASDLDLPQPSRERAFRPASLRGNRLHGTRPVKVRLWAGTGNLRLELRASPAGVAQPSRIRTIWGRK